ncbi:MAG: ATP-binding protein, partial [Bacteroidota bacterium]
MIQNIIPALQQLQKVVQDRLGAYFSTNKRRTRNFELTPLKLSDTEDPLARFIQYYQLSTEESLLVLIALAPHVLPDFYDTLIAQYLPEGGNFPAFGGVKGEHRRTMLPTGETALFILAGNDVQRRLQLQMLLSNEHFFTKQKILYLDQVKSGEPLMSGKLILDQEYVEMFTLGQISIPKLSTNFPAQYISTELEWQDLVLHEQTLTQ